MENISEQQRQEIEDKCVRIGVLRERNRILNELNEKDLPLGVWSVIRNVICPE